MILSKYIINYICLKKIINVVYKHLLSSVKGLCSCLAFTNVIINDIRSQHFCHKNHKLYSNY